MFNLFLWRKIVEEKAKEIKVKTDNNKEDISNSLIKPFLGINIERGGRKYVFSMEVGSPIGEAYDAAYMVLAELLEMSKRAVENAKPKKDKEEKENSKGK